jgi:NAD(P)-dependent dehydrogenase (short-subunit alcohol dehydrogenase family)
MSLDTLIRPALLPPVLHDQTVVVVGGGGGIGLETARCARARGAEVVFAGSGTADLPELARFFEGLPGPVDHVLLISGGPYHSCLAEMDLDRARREIDQRIVGTLAVTRLAAMRLRPLGSLLIAGGSTGRRVAVGNALISAMTAAMPPLVANLAMELAPIRVNLIAPGFVDPKEVAALAVHLMNDTALSGMTFDFDADRQQRLAKRRADR